MEVANAKENHVSFLTAPQKKNSNEKKYFFFPKKFFMNNFVLK